MRVVWNTSHQEFTVFDFYYFSKLKKLIEESFTLVENKQPLDEANLEPDDTLIINYPEKEFSSSEIQRLKHFLENGGKLIVSAYYQNEDNVASICSKLLSFADIKFRHDGVETEEGLLTTAYPALEIRELVSGNGLPFKKVFFPCSCSLETNTSNTIPLLKIGEKKVAVVKNFGRGRIIALGTSVFWDNFSISLADNKSFIRWLLMDELSSDNYNRRKKEELVLNPLDPSG